MYLWFKKKCSIPSADLTSRGRASYQEDRSD
jgi:hypothetical protein